MKRKFSVGLLLAFFVFLMVGCGKPESQVAFDNMMKEFHSGEYLKEKNVSNEEKMILEILKKNTYKVNKVEEKKDKAVLNVTIKAIDMQKYMAEYIQKVFVLAFSGASEDSVISSSKNFFKELANRKDLEYTEKTIDVYMQKDEGKWNVTNEFELFNAYVIGLDKLGIF